MVGDSDSSGDPGNSAEDSENSTADRTPVDPEPFSVPIDAVQPSQLYLNGRKLSLVTQWFDFAEPNYDPLPVRTVTRERDGGEWMLTDGHTCAFAAYLAGASELRVVRDGSDLQVGVYRRCLDWCEDEGVTEIADLAGRVLNADDFEDQWVARCEAVDDE